MFAVFSACGKQYKVSPGDVVYLDATIGEMGKSQAFKDVLLVEGTDTVIGKPLVSGAVVTGEILRHDRGPKIRILKMKRRKNARRRMGARQDYTRVLVTEISYGKENETLDSKKKKAIIESFNKPAAAEVGEENN